MPAAGYGGTFLKPEQGSDNHWYLPNVSSSASDLILSALCKLPHPCVNREFIWSAVVLAGSLWSIFLCGCVILELVCGDPGCGWLGVFAGQVSWGRHPRAWWAVGCQTASPRVPSCCASSSWLPPWELMIMVSCSGLPGRLVSLTGNNLKVQAETHTCWVRPDIRRLIFSYSFCGISLLIKATY